jgi:uncharacterized membrane protein
MASGNNELKMNQGINARTITVTALTMALICITTMFIKVPIPLGYAHLGDTIILLTGWMFGKKIGLISSGFGSALADLLGGYATWALPTLIIKIIMGLIIGSLAFDKNRPRKISSLKVFAAVVLTMVWMVVAYTIGGAVLYGSIAAGLASTPGLILEGIVNAVIFYVAGYVLQKTKVVSLINKF